MKIKKIYIASPLFNPAEKEENCDIANILEMNKFEVFLPQRDGFQFAELVDNVVEYADASEIQKLSLELISLIDKYMVNESDGILFNMNGRVPDEGAVFETGIAYATGKHIVIYKNDIRTIAYGVNHPLITSSSDYKIVDDILKIPQAFRDLEKNPNRTYSKTIDISRKIFKEYNPKNKDYKKLIERAKEFL